VQRYVKQIQFQKQKTVKIDKITEAENADSAGRRYRLAANK
jgi:hypothetical protein